MSWRVTVTLRKNSRSGSALQKQLKAVFGDQYYLDNTRSRECSEHNVQAWVSLPWDLEGTERNPWAVTLEPLTRAIADAMKAAGIQIAASHIDGHQPEPGHRVEFTLRDLDHFVTYYNFETEAGKKQARARRKPAPPSGPVYLTDILSLDNGTESIPNF